MQGLTQRLQREEKERENLAKERDIWTRERETLKKERTYALERVEKAERGMADFAVQKNALLMQVCSYFCYLRTKINYA